LNSAAENSVERGARRAPVPRPGRTRPPLILAIFNFLEMDDEPSSVSVPFRSLKNAPIFLMIEI
jgi:hypothetical protein